MYFLMTRSWLLARVPLLNYAYWWSSRLLILIQLAYWCSLSKLINRLQIAYWSFTKTAQSYA
jgi:hypothetical protein